MRRRIALWALCGLLVASFWVVFALAVGPAHNTGRWPIVVITTPIALLGQHMPLAYYWAILLNGVTYALFGLAFELIRRLVFTFKPAH